MPVHDWKRVESGIFHSFHASWIPEIGKSLNNGILPEGYYALAEQHTGRAIADILTLQENRESLDIGAFPPSLPTGGTAIADAPPKVRKRRIISDNYLKRQRSLAIRHVSGHRLVALLEIVSPGNKDRLQQVNDFVNKAIHALESGIHLLIVDIIRSGRHDPNGMNAHITRELEGASESEPLPPDEPLTLASYTAGPPIEIFAENVAVEATLPDMPLFISSDRYVNVPLETTYCEAFRAMPAFWRVVLEGERPARPV